MQRLFSLVALFCALCLVAVAPVHVIRPTPAPPVVPLPRMTMPALEPTVIIYPFDTSGGLDAKVGKQIADIFSKTFNDAGHVHVLPVPTNVTRTDFLKNAQAQKADYYISGYVTPIGDTASVVVQVVSVQSGVIVFAQTREVSNYNDAASSALASHDVILQISGTNVDVATSEAPTSAPSAAPTTNGATFNLGHLFGGHRAASAPRAQTPRPSDKPDRGVIIVAVHGSDAPAEYLARATTLLEHDLAAHFTVRSEGAPPSNLATAADSICGTERNNTIASGVLSVEHIGGIRPRTRSIFTLEMWTCFGDVLYKTTKTNDDTAKAIADAVTDYVAAHPSNG
ncbi:MAG: hypothetical protein ACREMP_03580 [Candidatus Tyrphobacter sp.]